LGINLNQQDDNGDTPFCHAAKLGYVEMLKALYRYGANPFIYDRWNETSIIKAASANQINSLMAFCELGIDLNKPDVLGNTVAFKIDKMLRESHWQDDNGNYSDSYYCMKEGLRALENLGGTVSKGVRVKHLFEAMTSIKSLNQLGNPVEKIYYDAVINHPYPNVLEKSFSKFIGRIQPHFNKQTISETCALHPNPNSLSKIVHKNMQMKLSYPAALILSIGQHDGMLYMLMLLEMKQHRPHFKAAHSLTSFDIYQHIFSFLTPGLTVLDYKQLGFVIAKIQLCTQLGVYLQNKENRHRNHSKSLLASLKKTTTSHDLHDFLQKQASIPSSAVTFSINF
jgi:hypothetical protein